MIRLFLAFDISDEVKKNLGALVETIRPQSVSFQAGGVKWVEPKNFHVTLKFFGNVEEEEQLPAIQKVIEKNTAGFKPAALTCEGLGAFPNWRTPRVIWAGLKGEGGPLIELQKKMEEDFAGLGFKKENREFALHLTLARIKVLPRQRAWLDTLQAMPSKNYGAAAVDRLTLYKSTLTKAGPIYTAIQQFRLNAD